MALRAVPMCGRAAVRASALRLTIPATNLAPATVVSFTPTAVSAAESCHPRFASAQRQQLRAYSAQAEAEKDDAAKEGAKDEPESKEAASEEQTPEPEKKDQPEGQKDEAADPRDQKIKELTENLKYALAETDNARKIAKKDVDNAKKYALKSFAKDLLEVADNMERAAQSVKPGDGDNSQLGPLLQGIQMTHNSLTKAFENNGIEKIEAEAGSPFDPELHEALMNMPWSEGKEPGTIGAVFKTGYIYRGLCLRATQCGVIAEKED